MKREQLEIQLEYPIVLIPYVEFGMVNLLLYGFFDPVVRHGDDMEQSPF